MSRLCCVIDMSVSRTIPAAVVDGLSAMHPTLDIRYRNLVAAPTPHISLPGFATDQAAEILDEFLAPTSS